jgi:GAF domain-containing protein
VIPNQPVPAQPSRSLVEAFSEIASHIHSSEDYEETMRRITETAVSAVSGCESSSLSLLEKHGPATHAATSELALRGDQIQYDEGEGPCLDAAQKQAYVLTADLAHDPRWPKSSTRIANELGVGSMLSCRLTLDAAPNHTLGGLNMYASAANAFSDEDQMMAILLASLGAVVVASSRQQASLRAAIESRQVIGEAIGMLRSQTNMSREEAFTTLARASQRMNVKLRDIADRITEGSVRRDLGTFGKLKRPKPQKPVDAG